MAILESIVVRSSQPSAVLPVPAPQLSPERRTIIDNLDNGRQFVPVHPDAVREDLETERIIASFERARMTVADALPENAFHDDDEHMSDFILGSVNPDDYDDLEVFEGEFDETMASIHMVDTRNTSYQAESNDGNETLVPTEVRPPPAVSSDLARHLEEWDKVIACMEKKIEELTASCLNMQMQPSSSAGPQVEPDSQRGHSERQRVEQPSAPFEPEKDMRVLAYQYVREAVLRSQRGTPTSKGRPYPKEYSIPYPPGFVPLVLRIFDGTEDSWQHLAHFKASYCSLGDDDALLFRQFVRSLSGTSFDD